MPITAGAIIGLGSGIYQTISGSQQQKKGQQAFESAMAARPQYQISDTVKQQLAEAQSRYNAQNPAIAMAYQQAQQGMAGQMANAQRNASSGAQALAAGAGAQAQLQSIAPQLAAQQAAYSQQQQANLNQARGLMTEEQRTKFSDMLSANQARQNFGLGLAQSGSAMKSQGLGAMVQGGLGLASAGLSASSGGNAANAATPTVANPGEYYNNPMINPAAAPNTTGFSISAYNLQNNKPLVFGSEAFPPANAPKLNIPTLPVQMPSQLPIDNTASLRLRKAFGQQPFSNTNPFPTPIYPNYGSTRVNLGTFGLKPF
jgi:hypothetical protein